MSMIIFSPSQIQFWDEDKGVWTDQVSNATEFSVNQMGLFPLPGCEGNDARFVNSKLYSSEDFDGIVSRLIETILDADGDTVAQTLNQYFDYDEIVYLGDSLWNFDDDKAPSDFDENALKSHLKERAEGMDFQELENTYNQISANVCYWDGNEFYIHATRL